MAPSRGAILDQLRALSNPEISEKSTRVIAQFFSSEHVEFPDWKGVRVGLFRSLKREVQLGELETRLFREGARLCYPRIVDSGASLMRFVQVDDPFHPESWEPGPYGGTEPKAEYATVAPGEIDLILVPGLAFGRSGERIGRGKGYYDRYLAGDTRALRLALCFDFQLFPSLKQTPWDQRVHRIVTETTRLETKR